MPINFMSIAFVSDGLRRIVVRYRDSRGSIRDQTLWSLGKQRKSIKCAKCKEVQYKGAETFRPITNKIYRAVRLCMRCSEAGMRTD